ncbi:polycystic kidney disease protein 1-like 1 [Molossus molossus]|uniref:polycystic kidney disease protein 1-like 1 n=1 Tax=Molossus molossus TaxID=27622 RepID=UPI001746533B|nr:polycystic kidney disease protein 1-like 1 [Molossus molossus]
MPAPAAEGKPAPEELERCLLLESQQQESGDTPTPGGWQERRHASKTQQPFPLGVPRPRARPAAVGPAVRPVSWKPAGLSLASRLRGRRVTTAFSVYELPGPLAGLIRDSLPTCHPEVEAPKAPCFTDTEIQRVPPRDPSAHREDCELSLGRTRPAAREALTSLRARRWVGRHTGVLSVHFTLYNPPARLFSSVSLSAQVLPAGGLVLSPLVESVTIFHSDSAPRYHLVLPQLAFLALALTHLCLQLYRLAEKGVRGYWREPGNWLELPIAGTGLTWCAASGHLLSLAGEAADQLQQGFLQEPVDLSHMAAWSQV